MITPREETPNDVWKSIKELQRLVDDIVLVCNGGEPVKRPEPTPPDWSLAGPPKREWRKVSENYFMPPDGFKNKEGVHVAGMVKRDEVPAEILARLDMNEPVGDTSANEEDNR